MYRLLWRDARYLNKSHAVMCLAKTKTKTPTLNIQPNQVLEEKKGAALCPRLFVVVFQGCVIYHGCVVVDGDTYYCCC